MLNLSYLFIGIVCLGLGYWFLKFDNSPSWNAERGKKATESGIPEDDIWAYKFSEKIRDLKGWFGGIGIVILGLLLIYLSFRESSKSDIIWDFITKIFS